MTSHSSVHLLRATVVILATVAIPRPVTAQTAPPQPNFSVRQETRFWFGAWPGDCNRDGRTDLIAGTGPNFGDHEMPRDLVVASGRGDGTFGASRLLGIPAQPIGTGDVNGDGKLDVVISGSGGLAVLPGNGNGTFGAPRTIAASISSRRPFAVIGDFNNDGHRDIVANNEADESRPLLLFPGNGDFTFAPELVLPISTSAAEGISGDFNKDGRRITRSRPHALRSLVVGEWWPLMGPHHGVHRPSSHRAVVHLEHSARHRDPHRRLRSLGPPVHRSGQ